MASVIHCDSLWSGANIVTMRDGHYNIINDGAIAVTDGKIIWIGEYAALPAIKAEQEVIFPGGIITPGLIDCHTHLIFGGDRSDEFEQRLNGVSYAEIAAQGVGLFPPFRLPVKLRKKHYSRRHYNGSNRCWQKALPA